MAGDNPFSSNWVRGGVDARLRPPGGQSYVAGLTVDGLKFFTISQLLDRAVSRYGARDAAIFDGGGVSGQGAIRLSWYDLSQRADQVAGALLALGIRRGNRVGIWSPNRVEWLLAQFGTARIGAILVNINPAYRETELDYALNKVRCRALITARGYRSGDYLSMLRSLAPELDQPGPAGELEARRLPHLKHVIVLDAPGAPAAVPRRALAFHDFLRLPGPAQMQRLASLSAALDPDDAINIQFTSGTTGAPKGATLSHFNIVNNARFSAKAMQLSERDRLCIPVPLYHCFGMVLGVLACTASGATMVFPGEGFDARDTLATVARQRCTALHGVPTMFIAMLDHPQFAQFDLSSLRTGIMAGAPCPIDVMRRVMSQMHMEQVTIGYGMTETSPISFQSGVDDPLDARVSTVGRVQPHLQVKIIDSAARIVPVGQQGELCTRGYSVMRGYWEDDEQTRAAIDDSGWMHSGDLATLDENGFCNIVGRVKDMVIRGGENIYPREVEEFLRGHPAVSDVQVFGVPDRRYGEELCAWVIARPGAALDAAALTAFCQGKIAHFKVPRHVRIVREYPITATGKPQKFAMREVMMRELGVQA